MRRVLAKLSPLVHPLLFAVFPILFLYAHNVDETSADQVLMPMLFSVAGALVLWILLSLLLRSALKAGLATTIFVILFFSYGRFYDLLDTLGVFVPSHGHLLPAFLLAWVYCVYFIKVGKRDFRTTTKLLNVVAVALVLLNVFSVIFYDVRTAKAAPVTYYGHPDLSTIPSDETDAANLPDIYLVFLDEYASPITMAEYYDYDDSWFTDSLASKGFFIASNSTTRTNVSHRSIASTLNMEYVGRPANEESVYRQVADSEVAEFLKARGYTYVYFGSWYETGKYEVQADLYRNAYVANAGALVTEFPSILWNTTMLRPFYRYLTKESYGSYYRRGVLDTLEYLKEVPTIAGPKLVVAHVMCPHQPFVFGPNGEAIDPHNGVNYADKQYYLGQYVFISRQIEKVVDVILEKSATPPIIVLQSDHGLRLVGRDLDIPADEWKKILNCYYLPNGGNEDLYDSISPANSFRVIFNHYFGADYVLLDENS